MKEVVLYEREVMQRWIKAIVCVCGMLAITLFSAVCFLLIALGRSYTRSFLYCIYNFWVARMRGILLWQTTIQMNMPDLDLQRWYVVIANHQSWADILVLQIVLNQKIPHLRFVMKQELKWVPFIGLICQILGYPLIDRSKPKKAYQALNTALNSVSSPSSLVIFPEGTRYHPDKAIPGFTGVLPPKVAGLYQVLSAWHSHHPHVLHVKIHYQGTASLWAWILGQITQINIGGHIVHPPLEKKALQTWLTLLWKK